MEEGNGDDIAEYIMCCKSSKFICPHQERDKEHTSGYNKSISHGGLGKIITHILSHPNI
jgi:hypothetical protein